VIVIAGNLLLNPLASPVVPTLGLPFVSAHDVSFGALPNDGPLQQLVSIIPRDAVVTAPLPAYSLVADDPYAYPMIPNIDVSRLPGSPVLPAYVLLPYHITASNWNSTLFGAIYDPSDFGVRGCISNSSVGGVELFQRYYTGAPQTFGPQGVLCPNYFSADTGLTAGPFASVVANSSSPSGVVIRSAPCATNATLWTGPPLELPPGQYRLQVVISAVNDTAAACRKALVKPTYPMLSLHITGRNGTASLPAVVLRHNFRVNTVCTPTCGGWYYWNGTLSLVASTPDISISGVVLIGQYVVQVSYLLLVPPGP
jgi:hypothetical protein